MYRTTVLILLALCAVALAGVVTYSAWQGRPVTLAPGVVYTHLSHGGAEFDVVEVDLKRARLDLLWRDADGKPLDAFSRAGQAVAARGRKLVFATNAGIFDRDRRPVGLHVEDGAALVPINTDDGAGNFYLRPNGVFLVTDDGVGRVMPTDAFAAAYPEPDDLKLLRLATQSGPLLLHGGVVNSAFGLDAPSKKTRSAVAADGDRATFVLSTTPVTFRQLADVFRLRLRQRDALYLDGEISRFHLPGTPRLDADAAGFAGILVVTTPAP
jgi:uncharacterized protein YigE (DUF2233 family)